MSPHASRILALLILLIVAVWAALAYIGSRTGAEATVSSGISVTYSREGTMHTYAGTVAVPACKELSAGLKSVGIDPPHITLVLAVEDLPECAAGEPSVQEFTLAYGSPTGASPLLSEVLLNGIPSSFKIANY